MGVSRVVAVGAVLVTACLCGSAAEAQEICGGIAGIPCADEGQFCLLPDGNCCCDFFGVCTDIPDACPAVCDPVCGCDGVTYGNRCEAHAARVSIAFEGPCDPTGTTVRLTEFTSLHRLFWEPLPEVHAYNVYWNDGTYDPPSYDGRCLYAAVPESSVLLKGAPRSGRAWKFRVTALAEEGEGPIGPGACGPATPSTPCTCTLPADVGPCDGTFPRWYHDYTTGQCELFVWGGCGGNANKFLTEEECAAECLDPCRQPAVHGDCQAAIRRWYHNVLSGHCEEFTWGGCDPGANNFQTIEDCRVACGDICLLPPDPGDCDGICPRWYFDPGSGRCEEFIWGCCAGNRNNFATEAECRAACAALVP